MGGPGCYSYVGQIRGKGQEINLGSPACLYLGMVLHETLHGLGRPCLHSFPHKRRQLHIFFISSGAVHEQSRPDRDYYVSILMENVQPDKQHNFRKASNDTHSGRGTPFDPHSIMIYGPKDFGIQDGSGNRKTTLQPRDPQVEIR